MSISASFINMSVRFNAMSLRERALLFAASVAVLIVAWDGLLMRPLERKRQALTQDLQSVQTGMQQLTASVTGGSPLAIALTQQQSLQQSLAAVDAQLQTVAAGLIPPQRMVAALRDMLDRQQSLRLVSLKNLPARSLAPPSSTPGGDAGKSSTSGPYVHSIEMVIEGDYLTILKYLQSVESLKWRFYWQTLDLNVTEYPMNQVRIRLNSLSMDRDWLGV